MATKREQFAQDLLDASLREFATAAEPRAGVEDRAVAAIAAADVDVPAHRSKWQWVWAAAAVSACLILAWTLWPARSHAPMKLENANGQQAPVVPQEPERNVAKIVPPVAKKPVRHGVAAKRRTLVGAQTTTLAQSAEPLPKLEVFPSPAPLSDEEKNLFSFLRLSSTAKLAALGEMQEKEREEQERRMEAPVQMNLYHQQSGADNTR